MSHGPPLSGDDLLRVLAALGNPHRIRIIASLFRGRNYVSQLAREMEMSRPLLHMHLKRLEASGLVTGSLELSDGGKAMRYFEVTPFAYELTPEQISQAARTLTEEGARQAMAGGASGKRELPPGKRSGGTGGHDRDDWEDQEDTMSEVAR